MEVIHSKKFLCLCNATFRICLVYDHIHSDLLQLQKEKKHFYEEELWVILDSMVEALYTLQLKGIHHGNVTLSHLLYSQLFDNSPCYKLQYDKNEKAMYHTLLKQNSGINQLILPNGEIYYLNPLLYQSLKTQNPNPEFSIHQDAFALAMCVLQLALGIDDAHKLLDLYEEYFNNAKLLAIFNEIKYSKKLIWMLSFMIKEQPDFIELSQRMNEIRSKRVFHHNKPVEFLYSVDSQKRAQNKFQSRVKDAREYQSSFPTHLSDMQQHTVLHKDNQTDIGIYMDLNYNDVAENRYKGELAIEGGKYRGEIQNGKRDGYGQMEWPDGSFYLGFWSNNIREGNGTLYSKYGSKIFDGQFLDNRYHGFGVLRNDKIKYDKSSFDYKNFSLLQDQWLTYEGDFKLGRKHGFGSLELSNGEKLVCQFIDDLPSGVGVFHRINNQPVNGKWDNGIFIQEL